MKIFTGFFGKCKIFHKKYEKNYGNNLNFLYVFSISGGFRSGIEKKIWVSGGFGSGKNVEILDRVCRVFRVFRVEEAICNRDFEEEDEGERGKADTGGYRFW